MLEVEQFFRKIFFLSNWSSEHVECSVANLAAKICQKSEKYFAECPKMTKNTEFFQKKDFAQNAPPDT